MSCLRCACAVHALNRQCNVRVMWLQVDEMKIIERMEKITTGQ